MYPVFRLPWELNLLLPCFGLSILHSCILKQLTQPVSLTSLNRGTGTVLYSRGQLGSIWEKKRQPPPFTHLAVLFFYGVIAFKYLQWLVHMINVAATNKLCLITIERWKFCFRGLEESGYHFYSRYFAPWVGIPEDPVCGSAHTVLAPFWQAILDR